MSHLYKKIPLIALMVVALASLTSCEQEFAWLGLTPKTSSSSPEEPAAVLHTCTFLNYDDSLLEIDKVLDGTTVRYLGDTPKRAATLLATYHFTGWDKPLTDIKGDTTFKAQFREDEILYTIRLFNDEAKTQYLGYTYARYGKAIDASRIKRPSLEDDNEAYHYFKGFVTAGENGTIPMEETLCTGNMDFWSDYLTCKTDSSKYTFSLHNDATTGHPDGYSAAGYTGLCVDGNLFYPAYHEGDPVVSVGRPGDAAIDNATLIPLAENVRFIESNFFKVDPASLTAPSLKEVWLPTTLTSVGDYAFYGCSNLTSFTVESVTKNKGLNNPGFNSNLTTLGQSAFEGCSALTSLTLWNSDVHLIPESCFKDCRSFEWFDLGYNGRTVGKNAFANDTGLTTIVVPPFMTKIDEMAFTNCPNLKKIFYWGDSASDFETEVKPAVATSGNDSFLNAELYYFKDTQPTDTSHKYWHYTTNWIPAAW